jgi:riboflavin synthase
MFTGIVEEVGQVKETTSGKLTIGCPIISQGISIGDSVAVNGACLTVTEIENKQLTVEITPETLRCTNLGQIVKKDRVNLERSLTLTGRLGGHIVQGHIETTGTLLSINQEGNATIMSVSAPKNIMAYVVPKGFIAVDGVSLTIIRPTSTTFTISVIPYSLENTVLRFRKLGDALNLETDIVARYVERLVKKD